MMMHKTAMPVLSIKAMDDDTGQIEGYASLFDTKPDRGGDVVVRGAYAKSLAEHRAAGTMPKMFWQHDMHEVIGKWNEAEEDDTGLLMRGELNFDVQRGREAYSLLKAEAIDGLSIGYRTKDAMTDPDTKIRFLKELELFEVSLVSIPMQHHAAVASVKAMEAAEEQIERLKAGERLTEREFELVFKGALGLSNSQAERAVRVHLKGQGEPAVAACEAVDFFTAMLGQ